VRRQKKLGSHSSGRRLSENKNADFRRQKRAELAGDVFRRLFRSSEDKT
jgi:hypothetical protein